MKEKLIRPVTILVSESMAKEINQLAQDDRRTFSQMARMLLERGIDEWTTHGKVSKSEHSQMEDNNDHL